VNGESIRAGHIYIAPPDRHLLVRQGWIELSRGPRENHSRPAVDPLFRSAARAYGSRVIGVVLSGALYDGSMGLLVIKTRGGVAIVQDPLEAEVDSMPRSAFRLGTADEVMTAEEIAPALNAWVGTPIETEGVTSMSDREDQLQTVIAEDFAEQAEDRRAEESTMYNCPDCGGVLWQDGAGRTLSFRCHVGHAYGPEVLLSQKSEEFEAALWASLRLLKEKATLTRQMAARTRGGGNGKNATAAERIEEQAELDERYVRTIQEILEAMPNPADQAAVVARAMDDAF